MHKNIRIYLTTVLTIAHSKIQQTHQHKLHICNQYSLEYEWASDQNGRYDLHQYFYNFLSMYST